MSREPDCEPGGDTWGPGSFAERAEAGRYSAQEPAPEPCRICARGGPCPRHDEGIRHKSSLHERPAPTGCAQCDERTRPGGVNDQRSGFEGHAQFCGLRGGHPCDCYVRTSPSFDPSRPEHHDAVRWSMGAESELPAWCSECHTSHHLDESCEPPPVQTLGGRLVELAVRCAALEARLAKQEAELSTTQPVRHTADVCPRVQCQGEWKRITAERDEAVMFRDAAQDEYRDLRARVAELEADTHVSGRPWPEIVSEMQSKLDTEKAASQELRARVAELQEQLLTMKLTDFTWSTIERLGGFEEIDRNAHALKEASDA